MIIINSYKVKPQNIPLTQQGWEELVVTRTQLPKCCRSMDMLWSAMISIGIKGAVYDTCNALIIRYSEAKDLHDLSGYTALIDMVKYAYNVVDYHEYNDFKTEAEQLYNSWF